MRLSKALEEKILDIRLRDKHLSEGKITKEQINDYLSKLEDSANNSQSTDDEGEGDE